MSYVTERPISKGSLHNPFRTYSNFIYPKTIEEVLIWAQWFWDRNAKYRNAIQKVVTYFVSSISVTHNSENNKEVDTDSIEQLEALLLDKYNLMSLIVDFGIELAAMGNVFISAERIISRQLLCPECSWIMSIKKLRKDMDYTWDGKHFKGKCPQCGKQVTFKIKDTPTQTADGKKIRFVFRSAADMSIQYNRLTGTYKYFYKMPPEIKNAIQRGDAVYLEDAPEVFLQASSTDAYIEFPEDNFLAMRTTTLSSLDKLYEGWGMPLFMSSFDNFIRLQHLDKFNEAVTMDYIAPIRLLSPAPGNLQAGADDPNRMPISGNQFRMFMRDSLRRVKENPTTWIISPIPVQYQMLGGEAKQLAPVDLMEWYVSQNLSDMGIPQEFRQTSFQVVVPSMGLRMFERQWIHFSENLNTFTKWASNIIANAHALENLKCTLDTTSFIEDDMNKQVLLGLMQSGMVSKSNIFKRIGIDFEDDIKQKVREQLQEEEVASQVQNDMENKEMVGSVIPPAGSVGVGQAQMNIQQMQEAAAGGGMPQAPMAPAAPMGMSGGAMPFNTQQSQSASIEQLYMEAQQLAQQLYSVPQNVRTRELVNLKTNNPTLHAMVKQMLVDMKQQVASDAVAQSQAPQG